MADLGKILLLPRGDYNANTSYEILDLVRYNRKSYVCKSACKGVTPSSGTAYYWQIVSEDGNGITGINIVSTVGKKTTYRITYDNGGHYDFVVTDGADNIATTSVAGLVKPDGEDILVDSDGTISVNRFYGVCNTARDVVDKIVTIPNIKVILGTTIAVKFTDAGTTAPTSSSVDTLEINGVKGDIHSGFGGDATTIVGTRDIFYGGRLYEFTYDGTNWILNVGFNDNTLNTTGTSQSTDKMYIVGGKTQNANGVVTNTNNKCYIGNDNELYSNEKKVAKGLTLIGTCTGDNTTVTIPNDYSEIYLFTTSDDALITGSFVIPEYDSSAHITCLFAGGTVANRAIMGEIDHGSYKNLLWTTNNVAHVSNMVTKIYGR